MPKRKLSESFDALQAPLCNGRLALNVEALSKSSLPLLPRPSPLSAEQFARAFERGCEIGNGTEQGAHEDMGAMGAMGATPFVSLEPFDTDKLTLKDAVLLAVGACCFITSEIQEFVSALKGVPKDPDLHIAPLGSSLHDLIFWKSDGTFDFTNAGFAAHQALLIRHGDPLHRAVSMAYTTCESLEVSPISDRGVSQVTPDSVEELCAHELYSFIMDEAENEELENEVDLWLNMDLI